jgi:hypothetical protein
MNLWPFTPKPPEPGSQPLEAVMPEGVPMHLDAAAQKTGLTRRQILESADVYYRAKTDHVMRGANPAKGFSTYKGPFHPHD